MSKNQMQIPGTEAPVIKEIDTAAESYVKSRERHAKATKDLIEKKRELLEVVEAHAGELEPGEDEGTRVYRYDDEIVIFKRGENSVKVKAASQPEPEE